MLSKEGVICNIPPNFRFLDGSDVNIERIIVDSIRKYRWFYFNSMKYDVGIIVGFDRGHLSIINEGYK